MQLPSWYFVCFLFLATKTTQEIPTLALEVLYLYNVFSSLKGCSIGSLGSLQIQTNRSWKTCMMKTIRHMGVSLMGCKEVSPEAHARNARIFSWIICGLWLKKLTLYRSKPTCCTFWKQRLWFWNHCPSAGACECGAVCGCNATIDASKCGVSALHYSFLWVRFVNSMFKGVCMHIYIYTLLLYYITLYYIILYNII